MQAAGRRHRSTEESAQSGDDQPENVDDRWRPKLPPIKPGIGQYLGL